MRIGVLRGGLLRDGSAGLGHADQQRLQQIFEHVAAPCVRAVELRAELFQQRRKERGVCKAEHLVFGQLQGTVKASVPALPEQHPVIKKRLLCRGKGKRRMLRDDDGIAGCGGQRPAVQREIHGGGGQQQQCAVCAVRTGTGRILRQDRTVSELCDLHDAAPFRM